MFWSRTARGPASFQAQAELEMESASALRCERCLRGPLKSFCLILGCPFSDPPRRVNNFLWVKWGTGWLGFWHPGILLSKYEPAAEDLISENLRGRPGALRNMSILGMAPLRQKMTATSRVWVKLFCECNKQVGGVVFLCSDSALLAPFSHVFLNKCTTCASGTPRA